MARGRDSSGPPAGHLGHHPPLGRFDLAILVDHGCWHVARTRATRVPSVLHEVLRELFAKRPDLISPLLEAWRIRMGPWHRARIVTSMENTRASKRAHERRRGSRTGGS